MTRLQKAAVAEIVQPFVVAGLFIAILYLGGGHPARTSFEIASIIYMASLGFLQWRAKKTDGESGKFLTDQEKEISCRSDRAALRVTWTYLFTAALTVYGGHHTAESSGTGEYFILLVLGGVLAGQVSRAWGVFHYSDNPEALSKPIRFPG